jgi:hypothetical protein
MRSSRFKEEQIIASCGSRRLAAGRRMYEDRPSRNGNAPRAAA